MEKIKVVFFSTIVIFLVMIILQQFEIKPDIQLYLDKSGPLVGSTYPTKLGFDGSGIKIAVIDTGVDYNHPDLFGFGSEGKVIGGYDFIDRDKDPLDTNGHGTEVAGIIAADGALKGIASKAKILAYRVSSDGKSVSSDLIIKAIQEAIKDEADIINISLGVNKTNTEIDRIVNDAFQKGIVVVTAAGNNGPKLETIGSPGRVINAITVGATYNNNTASLVSTLEVGEKQYQVYPMLGTRLLAEPISAQILFGDYSRVQDLEKLDVGGSILLAERGSDTPGELVYFSEKEFNAAEIGVRALLVFNNVPGIFFGELIHENSGADYNPRIPTVSMSREEGLELKKSLQDGDEASLNVFFHPDFVAPFSSRGPVSPFYIKPDLVAPGAFVNTTISGGKYNLTSGTSFATPHVSGAAAILLQKNPNLKPAEITSILATTTDPVLDPYGALVSSSIAGSGRLNITKAFDAELIIMPHSLIFNLSLDNPNQVMPLNLKSLNDKIPSLDLVFESDTKEISFEYTTYEDHLNIEANLLEEKLGNFEATLIINDKKTTYRIPILIHVSDGSLNINEINGILDFSLTYPNNWSFAKISVTNKDSGQSYTTSITPSKESSLKVFEPGEYWIETQISTNSGVENIYGTISVTNPSQQKGFEILDAVGITLKPLLIISTIIGFIILVGIKLGRN